MGKNLLKGSLSSLLPLVGPFYLAVSYDKSGSKMGTDRRRIRSLRKNRCGLRSGGENCKGIFDFPPY